MALARDSAVRRIIAVFAPATRVGFYDSPAGMRELDHLIRNRLAQDLSGAAGRFREVYANGHRNLPPPTRDAPLGDPARIRDLASLKRTAERLEELAALIHALPAPANDRVWQKIRREETLLDQLIAWDYEMAEIGVRLADVAHAPGDPSVDSVADLVDKIRSLLRDRQALIVSVP